MSTATATRTDGGFYVRGTSVMIGRAPDAGGGETVALFAGLFMEAHPAVPYELANTLNRAAGLPEIGLPKKVREAPRVGMGPRAAGKARHDAA